MPTAEAQTVCFQMLVRAGLTFIAFDSAMLAFVFLGLGVQMSCAAPEETNGPMCAVSDCRSTFSMHRVGVHRNLFPTDICFSVDGSEGECLHPREVFLQTGSDMTRPRMASFEVARNLSPRQHVSEVYVPASGDLRFAAVGFLNEATNLTEARQDQQPDLDPIISNTNFVGPTAMMSKDDLDLKLANKTGGRVAMLQLVEDERQFVHRVSSRAQSMGMFVAVFCVVLLSGIIGLAAFAIFGAKHFDGHRWQDNARENQDFVGYSRRAGAYDDFVGQSRASHGHASDQTFDQLPAPRSLVRPGHQQPDEFSPAGEHPPRGSIPHVPTPRSASFESAGQVPVPIEAPRYLCPALVVPRENECLLAVPTLVSLRAAHGVSPHHLSFEVKDTAGKAVIGVQFVPPDMPSDLGGFGPSGRTILVLRPAGTPGMQMSKDPLATCKLGQEATGVQHVNIYDARNELYAHMVRVSSVGSRPFYQLTSGRSGLQLQFSGNFDEHAATVTNESQQQLASTEPSAMVFDQAGSYYKLRAASLVDVGLLLCGLFTVSHLEAQ